MYLLLLNACFEKVRRTEWCGEIYNADRQIISFVWW